MKMSKTTLCFIFMRY